MKDRDVVGRLAAAGHVVCHLWLLAKLTVMFVDYFVNGILLPLSQHRVVVLLPLLKDVAASKAVVCCEFTVHASSFLIYIYAPLKADLSNSIKLFQAY